MTPTRRAALTRRRKVSFWGRNYVIAPQLVNWIQGDGKQLIYFTPLNSRPNYYVVRIDSSVNLSNWERDEGKCFADAVLDDLYEAIENEFGLAWEEYKHDNGRTYRRHNKFPAADLENGCAWGELRGRDDY